MTDTIKRELMGKTVKQTDKILLKYGFMINYVNGKAYIEDGERIHTLRVQKRPYEDFIIEFNNKNRVESIRRF